MVMSLLQGERQNIMMLTNTEKYTIDSKMPHFQLSGGADFYNGDVIPQGKWTLTILMGHAWVFCNNRNIPLHKGESITIDNADGKVEVRALYRTGYAAYTAHANMN